jgi:hypothetical protein
METFTKGWSDNPDLRFGQVIENIKKFSGKSDLFYIEDDEMLEMIKSYFGLDVANPSLEFYWMIVPVWDGNSYMGLSETGLVKHSKETFVFDKSLIFESYDKCYDYVKTNLNSSYKPERVLFDGKYYKFK